MKASRSARFGRRLGRWLVTAVDVATGYFAAKHGWFLAAGVWVGFTVLCFALLGALVSDATSSLHEFRPGDRVLVVGVADYNGLSGSVAWAEDGRVGVWIEGGDLTTFLVSEVVDA